jgi:hypothetical protein
MSKVEKDEAITANAEKAFEELSKKLEHRELITEEEARKSRQFILDECNKGADDQIMGACSGVKRKLQAVSFYRTFSVRDGQDSALARLIVMLSEGAASCAQRALSLDVAGREIELALASRLALTVSTLNDALDRHRSRKPSTSGD